MAATANSNSDVAEDERCTAMRLGYNEAREPSRPRPGSTTPQAAAARIDRPECPPPRPSTRSPTVDSAARAASNEPPGLWDPTCTTFWPEIARPTSRLHLTGQICSPRLPRLASDCQNSCSGLGQTVCHCFAEAVRRDLARHCLFQAVAHRARMRSVRHFQCAMTLRHLINDQYMRRRWRCGRAWPWRCA